MTKKERGWEWPWEPLAVPSAGEGSLGAGKEQAAGHPWRSAEGGLQRRGPPFPWSVGRGSGWAEATPCHQITKKQCCWSGALRLGFTSKDPSRIHPDSLPKYACPDLVSQSGFWAKALPEEFANEGNIIAFWVDKKGRVFYRINDSAAMLFFNGVRTADPLWALVDVYGLTRGVQLLGECPLPLAPEGQGTSLSLQMLGLTLLSAIGRGDFPSQLGSSPRAEGLQGALGAVV